MQGSELFYQLYTNHDYKAPVYLNFYKREFLTTNNLTFKTESTHEDYMFSFMTMLKAQRVMHIPARLYNKRQSPESKISEGAFNDILGELESLGYDTSRLRPSANANSLKALIRRIPGVTKCFRLARNILRPLNGLDDEAVNIIHRLKETNTRQHKRIITLCVPRHGNRGDIAIALAQRKLFTENLPDYTLIELPGDICRTKPDIIIKNLNSRDILLTNGGGYFGSFWRHDELEALYILKHFPNNKIIIMPQTIYYSDNEQGRSELADDKESFAVFTNLHVFVRDRNSYDMIHRENLFPNAKSVNHVPDMVCSMDFTSLDNKNRSGVLVCLRPDIENILDYREHNKIYAKLIREFGNVKFWTTNPAQSQVKIHDWDEALIDSLKTLAGCEFLITDRLHGMLFAAVTNTPCVAFDNKTGKVHSVYEWIQDLGYIQICRDINEFDDSLKQALESPAKWDNSSFTTYFKTIINTIKE